MRFMLSNQGKNTKVRFISYRSPKLAERIERKKSKSKNRESGPGGIALEVPGVAEPGFFGFDDLMDTAGNKYLTFLSN